MAYTAPTTRATSELITASIWNTDLVNNIAFLANPPACQVYRSSTQSIANNTVTSVTWNAENYDTGTMHDTATNSDRITVPAAGLYVCEAAIQFQAAGDYTEILMILTKNGTIFRTNRDRDPGAANDVREIEIVRTIKLAAGDWVSVQTRQQNGAGAARTIGGAAPDSGGQFTLTWQGLG